MIKITEMGMPDWRISKIISEYRSLLKMTNALARETQPLFDLTAFIEDLLPAFAAMQQDGEISDGYEKLTELVLSDIAICQGRCQ